MKTIERIAVLLVLLLGAAVACITIQRPLLLKPFDRGS
jgi:hypothetical protein